MDSAAPFFQHLWNCAEQKTKTCWDKQFLPYIQAGSLSSCQVFTSAGWQLAQLPEKSPENDAGRSTVLIGWHLASANTSIPAMVMNFIGISYIYIYIKDADTGSNCISLPGCMQRYKWRYETWTICLQSIRRTSPAGIAFLFLEEQTQFMVKPTSSTVAQSLHRKMACVECVSMACKWLK